MLQAGEFRNEEHNDKNEACERAWYEAFVYTPANTIVQHESVLYNMQALASANHALPLTILPFTYLKHARPGHL
jgi:hypothetical protein